MKAICDAVDIPVVAIGGIHKENLLRLKGTGVNGVALVSAIFGAEDIEAECRELKALGGADRKIICHPAANRGHHLGPRYKIHGENQHEKRILRRCRHPERTAFSE